MIKENLLEEEDREKYEFIHEIWDRFNKDSLPDLKDIEKSLEYLDYFSKVMENSKS